MLIPIFEILTKVINFLIIIMMTRLLSIDDYGLFSYVVSVVMIISVLMDGGINNFIYNKSVKNELSSLGKYFELRSAVAFLVVVIAYIYFRFVSNDEVQNLILLYALFVCFNSSVAFFKVVARGQSNFKIDSLCIVVEPLLRCLLVGFCFIFWKNVGLSEILCLFLLSVFVSFLFLFYMFKQEYILKFDFIFKLEEIKGIASEVRYFLFYYLLLVAMQRAEFIYIKNILGAEEVAIYSSAFNLYAVIQLFFASMIASNLRKYVYADVRFRMKILFLGLAGVALTIISGMATSHFFYGIVYPETYALGYLVFNMLLIALPFYVTVYASIYYLNYLDLSRINAIVLFLVLIIKVLYYSFICPSTVGAFAQSYAMMEVVTCLFFLLIMWFKRHSFKCCVSV